MKRVIFTAYDDINQEKDEWHIHTQTYHMIQEYFDRLVENKREYAKTIGVDFKFYHNTMKDFDVEGELEFTKVNLYKHHLMAQLANEYDEVMYVDMDVLFNTEENVFKKLNLSKGIHIKDQDKKIKNKNIEEVLLENIGDRNPTLKYHITRDLLDGKDNHVMNTGVIIGKSKHIKQIKYAERMIEAVKKIQEIKNSAKEMKKNFLCLYYYANNESIFSYIFEKFKIPYVIMDKEWHYVIDDIPEKINLDDAKIIHFINKKFNTFFKDKTKAIFSLNIDIPDEKLDSPSPYKDDRTASKSKINKERVEKYKDKLRENHENYAKAISAEYFLFERDSSYEKFAKRFPLLSEYDIVNLYKVYMLDELTKKYDHVLYVDYDVYFRRDVDIFSFVPCESCICCNTELPETSGVELDSHLYYHWYNHDFRNPEAKFWNAHALLTEEDLDPENVIFNTGVMIASRKVMEQINYFGDIDEVIKTMKSLKESEFSMYPPQIQKSFGYDNETIMSYKTKKNNVPVYNIPKWWHHKNHYSGKNSFDPTHREYLKAKYEYETGTANENSVIIHFISKNFGLVFDQ
jgi:hypothetical protein